MDKDKLDSFLKTRNEIVSYCLEVADEFQELEKIKSKYNVVQLGEFK